MCDTNDGFKISEVDMQLRGPGDILGTQQSGVVDFKKLDLVADADIIQTSKKIVDRILSVDPQLTAQQYQMVRNYYLKNFNKQHKWSKIS